MKFGALSFAAALLAVTTAFAAEFTDRDYAYLRNHWGLRRDGIVVKNLTSDEKAKLHGLINDPTFRDNPQGIENQVGAYLFQIETCADRPDSEPCPNAPGPNDLPGKQVAYRFCISCHLVGDASVPSFFRMAQSGRWTAERLGAALRTGHEMSPITLSDSDLRDLAAYIASLR